MANYVTPVYDTTGTPTNIPDPAADNGFVEFATVRGAATVLADGTLRWQLVQSGNKRRSVWRWKGLTDTQKDTLESILNGLATSAKSVKTPANDTYSVVLDQGSDEVEFRSYTINAGGGNREMRYDAGPIVMREA